MTPVALVILDGWGLAPPGPGNAVALAFFAVALMGLRVPLHTRPSPSGVPTVSPSRGALALNS